MSFRPDYLGGGFSATFTTLTVTGDLTVNGDFNFGSASVQELFLGDNDYIIGGNTSAVPDWRLGWNTTQTVDGLFLGLATAQNTLIVAENGDFAFDFAHGAQTNPTIFLHSAAQSTTQWLSLTHDQTDVVISSGAGDIKLSPVTGSAVNSTGFMEQNMTISSATAGFTTVITFAAGASGSRYALSTTLNAGFTGNSASVVYGGYYDNVVAGTGSSYNVSGGYAFRPNGNVGFLGIARATTVGNNVGIEGLASNGIHNVGAWGAATQAKNSGKNIGVAGFGRNTGTTPVFIAGFFGIYDSGYTQITMPWGESAALVADIGASSTTPILDARNAGVSAAKIMPVGSYSQKRGTVTTTNATKTTVLNLNLANGPYGDGVYNIDVFVIGRSTSNTDYASYKFNQIIRVTAGTAILVGASVVVNSQETNAAWDCVLEVSGGSLLVNGTGAAGVTVSWQADVQLFSN